MSAEEKSRKPLISFDGRAIAKARDEWFASKEGDSCLQPYNFTGPDQVKYLKNRLASAFSAGVDAALALANEEAKKLGGIAE